MQKRSRNAKKRVSEWGCGCQALAHFKGVQKWRFETAQLSQQKECQLHSQSNILCNLLLISSLFGGLICLLYVHCRSACVKLPTCKELDKQGWFTYPSARTNALMIQVRLGRGLAKTPWRGFIRGMGRTLVTDESHQFGWVFPTTGLPLP